MVSCKVLKFRGKTEPGSRTLKSNPVFKALFYSENSLHLLSVTGFNKLLNTLYLPLISRAAQSLISHLKNMFWWFGVVFVVIVLIYATCFAAPD